MGENIGAAARAMLNFGLTRMRVVGPRDGWPNPKAVAMASGAGPRGDGGAGGSVGSDMDDPQRSNLMPWASGSALE